jgi:hypothetical protein
MRADAPVTINLILRPRKLNGNSVQPCPQRIMAEKKPETTLQEVKEYQYFQPELIEIIASENIYDEDRNGGGHQPWEIDE